MGGNHSVSMIFFNTFYTISVPIVKYLRCQLEIAFAEAGDHLPKFVWIEDSFIDGIVIDLK